jgi:hypothetical protein
MTSSKQHITIRGLLRPADILRLPVLFCVLLAFLPGQADPAEVEKEIMAKDAASTRTAFERFGIRRIGLLLVASDRNPDPGISYTGRTILTEHRDMDYDPFKMRTRYELRLYEALREAFVAHGYEVRNQNRKQWKGLKLGAVISQADAVDAVCAVHYRVKRKHVILDHEGSRWSTPFEGMHLKVRMKLFDRASGDLVYGLEATALGTEELHPALDGLVSEEALYSSGYDEHHSPNSYTIAIYNTTRKDLKTRKERIPLIRAAAGSLEITYVGGWTTNNKIVMDQEMRRLGVKVSEEVAQENSVLARLLKYVKYRPTDEDVEYFDRLSIAHLGELMHERIPDLPRP